MVFGSQKQVPAKHKKSPFSALQRGSAALLVTALISTALIQPGFSDTLKAEAPSELAATYDSVNYELESLRTQIVPLLTRVRNPGTLTALQKGGKTTAEEISATETRLVQTLNGVTAVLNAALLAGVENANALSKADSQSLTAQKRLDRANLLAQSYHLLISWAQIRALIGASLNSENPRFNDGSLFGVRISKWSYEHLMVYSPLYEARAFHNFSAPYSARAYSEDNTGTAADVIEYQADPSDIESVWIRPQRETLAQIAISSQLNVPTELAYLNWTRDLVLLALSDSIAQHAYLIGGDAEIAKWNKKLEAVIQKGALSPAVASRLRGILTEKTADMRASLWRDAAATELIAQAEKLPELSLDALKKAVKEKAPGTEDVAEQIARAELQAAVRSAFEVRGTEQNINKDTVSEFLIQRVMIWANGSAIPGSEADRDAKLKAVLDALKNKLDWKRIWNSRDSASSAENARLSMRKEVDTAYRQMAIEHLPLWKATQKRLFGYRKPTDIPESFLNAPIQLPLLIKIYTGTTNAMKLSGVARMRTLESDALKEMDASKFGEARDAYFAAIQELEKNVTDLKKSAYRLKEASQIQNDIFLLQNFGVRLGFNRGSASAPTLKELGLTDEQQRAYIEAYLEYNWNENTILAPQVTDGALGSLLERLAKSDSVERAHTLLDPALHQKLDAAIDVFKTVASAKKPEELADFLFVSTHIQNMLDSTVPGMKRTVRRWANEHGREETRSTWQQVTGEYAQTGGAFIKIMFVELGMKLVFRSASGLATRLEQGAIRQGLFRFLSPMNALTRTVSGFHQVAGRYFSSYFTAFLGIMAVDFGRHALEMREYYKDSDAMSAAYLAQSGGDTLYGLTDVKARAQAADASRTQFILGDVLMNGAFLFLGPILGGANQWITATRERAIMAEWQNLGVKPYEVYKTPKLWDEATIQKFADKELRRIRETMGTTEAAARANHKVETARLALLKIRARDVAAYELSARNFKGAFQDLGMKKPSFKDTEIRDAYFARIESLKTQAMAKNLTFLQKFKLRTQAESAERAYDDLRLFAESYAQLFTVGPLARIYHSGLIRANVQMELEYRIKMAENKARIWGQDPRAAAAQARAQFKMEVDGKTYDAELSAEENKKFADDLSNRDLDSYQLAVSQSRERRGQSIFDFWANGSAPRMGDPSNPFVWHFRAEPKGQSAAFDVRKNYYSILEVAPNADAATIDAAFNRLAELYKSGKFAEQSLQIASTESLWEAYQILSNPSARAAFDVFLISRGEWVVAAQNKAASAKATQDVKRWSNAGNLLPEETASRDAFVQRYASVNLSTDYYAVLGVTPTASKGDLTQALERLRAAAATSPEALMRFESACRAYELLADPVFRSYYDIVRAQAGGAQ